MPLRYFLPFWLVCFTVSFLAAQEIRYVDEVFSQVEKSADIVYGQNFSILTDTVILIDLEMDVYQPLDDNETSRPVVIYLHAGSFLPPFLNGQIIGARTDSSVINMCKRLARRGYVAIAATYRKGWQPLAADHDVRTGTLAQALYRGIQDFRTLVRFLRKDVTENGNTYGIDPERIVGWGQGTGGYVSLGAAYLDRYEELLISKFFDANAEPYIVPAIHGDIFGEMPAQLNHPNHPGYPSDFALAVSMGGALGDLSWIDGSGNEPPTIGYHFLRDPFTPFAAGPDIIPPPSPFLLDEDGTRAVVGKANASGINDLLDPANALVLLAFPPLSSVLNSLNEAYKTMPIPSLNTTLSTDHFYPFVTSDPATAYWDWWNKAELDSIVPLVNLTLGTNLSADALHQNALLSNPDMSAATGNAYLDTVLAHFLPRACQGLQLASCALVLDTDAIIEASLVDLKVMPNPAMQMMNITTDSDEAFYRVQLFDIRGRALRNYEGLRDTQFQLDRRDLPAGLYYLKLRFEKGVVLTTVQFL